MRRMADEDRDPQITEKTDVLLCAENIVDYIRFLNDRQSGLKWEPAVFRDGFFIAAVPRMLRAIHFLDYIITLDQIDLFLQMKDESNLNKEGFSKFTKTLSKNCFSKDFDAKYFLIYCLTVSILATDLYFDGIKEAPKLAKVEIHKLLQEYVSADGWKDIRSNAEKYVKMLEYSLKELTPSEIRRGSGKTVDPDEDESNKSNSSPSEKESVLLENADSNIEQQKERARSKIKKYLQMYAQYDSISEAQTGLWSLREAEWSSDDESPKYKFEGNAVINESDMDDKSRPGTSSIDEELFLHIKDFKMKVNLSLDEMSGI